MEEQPVVELHVKECTRKEYPSMQDRLISFSSKIHAIEPNTLEMKYYKELVLDEIDTLMRHDYVELSCDKVRLRERKESD